MLSNHYAFIVMSFSSDADDLYSHGIKPAVESVGLQAVRVDSQHFLGKITDRIAAQIDRAYIVIGELSHERPNCYYELGYAHGRQRPVLMAIDDPKKVYFDLRDFRFVTYASVPDLRGKLAAEIIGTVLRNGSDGADDSNAGKFGRSAFSDGYLLTADIRPVTKRNCEITLRVIPTIRDRSVEGFVKFYLHPETFDPAMRRVKAREGIATYDEVLAFGAFTVGAVLEDGTMLELNLASVPGGHAGFYRS